MNETDPLLTKPAKDLSDREAFDVLMYLFDTDEITLPDGVRRDPRHPDTILSPTPGAQLRVGPVMGDVTFRQANDATRPRGGAEGSVAITAFTPTPVFAVLLYRLGVFLHDQWQVTTVVCGGVGRGGGAASDCHSQGRCVDFYGVVRAGGQTLDVFQDWFKRPVYRGPGHQTWAERRAARELARTPVHLDRGAHWPGRTPPFDRLVLSDRSLARVVAKKLPPPRGDDDQWGSATQTYFRLGDSPEPRDTTPGAFFSAVYEFVAAQCTTGPADLSAAQFRGGGPLGRGFIVHPDYPHKGSSRAAGDPGRVTHHDHMHFQIGPTR